MSTKNSHKVAKLALQTNILIEARVAVCDPVAAGHAREAGCHKYKAVVAG